MPSAVQVFLSYAHSDQLVAIDVRQALQDCGFQVWADEPARPGESVAEFIASGLNAADAFVVILGRHTASRQWSSLEIGAAMARRKPIVPVLIDRHAEIPALLRDRQYLDLSDPDSRDRNLGILCEVLRRGPAESQTGRTATEFLEGASDALRQETEVYIRETEARERQATRLQLIATVVAVLAAAIGLIVASSSAPEIVSALAAGLGAALTGIAGFYFGSSRHHAFKRSSDRAEDHQ